jgi:hypothetical protein
MVKEEYVDPPDSVAVDKWRNSFGFNAWTRLESAFTLRNPCLGEAGFRKNGALNSLFVAFRRVVQVEGSDTLQSGRAS